MIEATPLMINLNIIHNDSESNEIPSPFMVFLLNVYYDCTKKYCELTSFSPSSNVERVLLLFSIRK
jgi:hypothetical protein